MHWVGLMPLLMMVSDLCYSQVTLAKFLASDGSGTEPLSYEGRVAEQTLSNLNDGNIFIGNGHTDSLSGGHLTLGHTTHLPVRHQGPLFC